MNSVPILFNTRPLKRGTDELLNPRIDKLIDQVDSAYSDFKYASGYLKHEEYQHAQDGLNKLAKIKSELKLIQRTISNHTS